jgi:hypothetical protein
LYDEPVAVEVLRGRHEVRAEASGAGWLRVSYVLEGYLDRGPNLYRALAMRLDDRVRLWIQHTDNTYVRRFEGRGPVAAPPADLVVPEMPARAYRIEWWDTVKGEPTGAETVEARDGALTIRFGGTLSDVACKIAPAR